MVIGKSVGERGSCALVRLSLRVMQFIPEINRILYLGTSSPRALIKSHDQNNLKSQSRSENSNEIFQVIQLLYVAL